MRELIEKLMESATEDRKLLHVLKNFAVKNNNYSLASDLRKAELNFFPEQKLTEKEYEETELFRKALKLVELQCSQSTSYKIMEVSKRIIQKGKKFDIKDAGEIQANCHKIFGEE